MTTAERQTHADESVAPTGKFVSCHGEPFYEIADYDRMKPFLMSIVSSDDHWMYVSSTGGLTAGRTVAEHCLFPYQPVDRVHDAHDHTGPLTLIRHGEGDEATCWRPFDQQLGSRRCIERRLRKHVAGDEVVFREVRADLGLAFQYSWRTSAQYGFVRTASVENVGEQPAAIDLLDGVQNLWPGGVPLSTYYQASCLVDAYKHNELDPELDLAVYSLTAQILDRAEAAEVLRATTVWRRGLTEGVAFLSREGVETFARGGRPDPESLATGVRGNYFVSASFELAPGETRQWDLVADVRRGALDIAEIRQQLCRPDKLSGKLDASLAEGRRELCQNVASADGLQTTQVPMATAHHFANVLFNNMRGGVFAENYEVDAADFRQFVDSRNERAAATGAQFLADLPDTLTHLELTQRAGDSGNADLIRLALEYMPLTFGRRHGDPSRPWNAFEIRVRDALGARIHHYQGNWRDIFQNWEALSASFPHFLPSIVAKFVNASTVDGYNPYRVTSAGIDWETPEPDNPWSNIGYWGDHQIVYLTRLLEALEQQLPGEIQRYLNQAVFSYANVPYRLKSFEQIAANSSETINFDHAEGKAIEQRVREIGADGKLVLDGQGEVYRVNLVEKLLTPVLAKLSNLVVDGGIWLNTQRPEWNDANNALVGAGLSMVAVCQLRHHLHLLVELLAAADSQESEVSNEVADWLAALHQAYRRHADQLDQPEVDDELRGRLLAEAGEAYSQYRSVVYQEGFSGKRPVARDEVVDFLRLAGAYLDHSIRASRRNDGLYHAYNLLEWTGDRQAVKVRHLREMLEGQVAALGSGLLDARETVELVDAMYRSRLYRPDQHSFLLYPDRRLPNFLQRNQIPANEVEQSELLSELVATEERSLVVRDAEGVYRFAADLGRLDDVEEALDQLAGEPRWHDRIGDERSRILDLYEEVFGHKAYTGRSGTMYGYEGLGCIYWHQVSKLLLAVGETAVAAARDGADQDAVGQLADAYYQVRSGLSSAKTPAEYGAFPADPYSHTPRHAGAQQPGMTGQVKEEILTRRLELGLVVRDGEIHFDSVLLRREEFLEAPAEFAYYDLAGMRQTIELKPGELAFTLCQTPIVYRTTSESMEIAVTSREGHVVAIGAHRLGRDATQEIFRRSGKIARIDVAWPG